MQQDERLPGHGSSVCRRSRQGRAPLALLLSRRPNKWPGARSWRTCVPAARRDAAATGRARRRTQSSLLFCRLHFRPLLAQSNFFSPSAILLVAVRASLPAPGRPIRAPMSLCYRPRSPAGKKIKPPGWLAGWPAGWPARCPHLAARPPDVLADGRPALVFLAKMDRRRANDLTGPKLRSVGRWRPAPSRGSKARALAAQQ